MKAKISIVRTHQQNSYLKDLVRYFYTLSQFGSQLRQALLSCTFSLHHYLVQLSQYKHQGEKV